MAAKIDGTNGLLQQYGYQVSTTGFSYTFAAGTTVLVMNPAGTLAVHSFRNTRYQPHRAVRIQHKLVATSESIRFPHPAQRLTLALGHKE